jgi:pimeloyl-ACP methyl ester carboxylesterase
LKIADFKDKYEDMIEDIGALIEEAGGATFLFGISSGAVLAFEATRKLDEKVKKLALYEPPFIVDDSRPKIPDDYLIRLNELIAANRQSDAVKM